MASGPGAARGPGTRLIYFRAGAVPALPLMTNCDPGSTSTSPSAEPVMVTSVRVALPRAPPWARIPDPLTELSMRTSEIFAPGTDPPPDLNWIPS